MSKKYIQELEINSCDECPARSDYTGVCFRVEPERATPNTNKIPDWCPLQEKE